MSDHALYDIFSRVQSSIENLIPNIDPLAHQKLITILRDAHIECLGVFINSETGSTMDQNKAFEAIIINNQSVDALMPKESPGKAPGCSCRKTFSF